eukprot:TRINITY_DN965_c0_g1_i3.p1 TRINITY_DN965_c0_g1~~TRINITY_DN965_c0_g1_i3.p1  ORF type:complete len:110 (+),score=20.71 TRINITY_DN965_c0_g1_i3:204-533(+)
MRAHVEQMERYWKDREAIYDDTRRQVLLSRTKAIFSEDGSTHSHRYFSGSLDISRDEMVRRMPHRPLFQFILSSDEIRELVAIARIKSKPDDYSSSLTVHYLKPTEHDW